MKDETPGQPGLAEAVTAYLNGTREAFDTIHEAYRTRLWYYLCVKANNQADAEDLFNIVALDVSQSLADLKSPEALVGWVLAIARNRLFDYYRRKRPEEVVPETPLPSRENDPETHTLLAQRRRGLRRCMARLPEPQRDYFALHCLGGLSQQEVCDRFRLNLNSLKSHIRRCKLALLSCLEQEDAGPSRT